MCLTAKAGEPLLFPLYGLRTDLEVDGEGGAPRTVAVNTSSHET
jgi:hypothetical protein